MAEQNWTIVDTASGEVLAQVITGGCHPRDSGWAWDAETQVARKSERQGDLATEQWNDAARAWEVRVDALRARCWAEVKRHRDALEDGAAATPLGPVQCDDRSKIKISGLVQMASLAAQAGVPFEEEFTLADNSVIVLDAPLAMGLGQAVGAYVSRVHAASRALRGWIESDERTAEELLALDVAAEFEARLALGGGDA